MVQRLPDIAPAAHTAPAARHEDIFLARYEAMRGWALRLTQGERDRAEDLVHDAYVHFTLSRPRLEGVENLDGYLFVMLRNLHTSQARRAARLRERMLPAIEYDSAAGASRAADPRDLARVHDELRACCRYACARMRTSKAGSVLALRFFHGYYPREIAAVARATRESVEERLRAARGEARQFLKDPSALRFMRDEARATELRFAREGASVLTTDELLTDLRRAIFNSREGDCPAPVELKNLYGADAAGIDTRTLAHVVCCPRCIDEVNRLLGLPPLACRFPSDMTERDERPRRKGDGGGDGPTHTPGGGASEEDVLRCRGRAREAFEHRPQELCVAVNGRVLATQSAGAPRCEQTLALPLAEGVEFVEVFSEQEVRLLFIDVNEHLAGARAPLSASVALSDERTLAATLSFSEEWPTVQVVYEDPRLAARQADAKTALDLAHHATRAPRPADSAGRGKAVASAEGVGDVGASASASELIRPRRASKISEWLANVSGRLTGAGLWLRPATLTAALAIVVVASLLLMRTVTPTASAAELLDRSAAAEARLASDAALVLHRTYFVEESAAAGATATRLRVEVWQSAARSLKLRRVFDREGRLVAGAWERDGGARRTVYRRGAAASESEGAPDALALLEAGEAWGLDLSARTFSALVGDAAEGVTVEDSLGSYVLSYREAGAGGARSLLSATLRLSKSDLRATGQTLVVGRGEARREYRFIEGGLEKLPAGSVAPGVFQPEPELSGASGDAGVGAPTGQGGAAPSAGAGNSSVPAVASPELEVEVAYLLNRIKADMGEQITWTRTTGGQLRVEALAETEGRKGEILRALGPVIGHPAVVLDVATVEERVRRERAREGAESVSEVEVRAGRTAADEDLRRHFSARLAGEKRVEAEIKAFGARAMSRSRAALLHASALRRLASRFTPEQARALRPEAREKWLAMLDGHAQAVRREVRALDGELRLVFPPGNVSAGAPREGSSPAAAAESLLRLAYGADEAVRSAFTAAAGGASTAAQIKSPQFWRSLREAERLAESIAEAYRK